jgi:hypothetical protein
LESDADDLRGQAEQPDAVRQQTDEPPGIAWFDTRVHRGALPQSRRKGEAHGGDECEYRCNLIH